MPQLIYGRAHSRFDEIFFEKVKLSAEKGRVLVIVPDQYSFEMEKQLYRHLGAKLFNSIGSAGIGRLCERIRRDLGGSDKSYANDATRIIAMYRAQSALTKSGEPLSCGRSLLRPQFVADTISLISRFIKSGASPDSVMAASQMSAAMSPRLRDMSLIYKAYLEELSQMGLADDMSEVARAAEMARNKGYFKGVTVFFDSFTGFSSDQLKLIDAVVSQADDVLFSILYDSMEGGSEVFAQTARTISRLDDITADHGKTLERIPADGGLSQTPALSHINNEYFKYVRTKATAGESVRVGCASDIYEESDYICSEIVRLTRECGYRYSDIAVICGALSETADIIAASAERYEIPYFVDRTASALDTLPSRYLMSILDAAVSREYRTEKVLRIVKSPLSPFFDFDANDLEEFCMTWNVEGDMWLEPFTPAGVKVKPRIEENRKRLIEPIEEFRRAAKNAPAADICEALFRLLETFKMSDGIYSQVRRLKLENETEVEFLRSFKQVWLGMVDSVRTIHDSMGDTVMTLRHFYELLRLMLGGLILSSPPQKADCVLIGDAERSRLSDIKVLFIMQANDGVFPRRISSDSLLRDSDIKLLDRSGIELELSPVIQLDSERMALYTALTAPSERLYVTYSLLSSTGDNVTPSQLPASLRGLFEDDVFVNISALPQDSFCTSYRTAFNSCLEHFKDNSEIAASVRASVCTDKGYAERLAVISAIAGQKTESLDSKTAQKLFFPENVSLNSTCIKDYYRCAFMYFCKYGLGLRKSSKMDIDAMHFGLIVHYCLEKVMSVERDGKRVYDTDFPLLTDKQLRSCISRFADEYVEQQMGGSFGKDSSFFDALSRLKQSVFYIAANFRDEMKDSEFIPVAFEKNLFGNDGKALLTVEADGISIDLHGAVDRADIYETEHGTWLRIVDYKSGKQSFSKSSVYNGLDLQMLIYLLALSSGRSGLSDKELIPCGLNYFHTVYVPPAFNCAEVYEFEQKGELEQQIYLTRANAYKPEGVMDPSSKDFLNMAHNGVYTVFSYTKAGAMSAAGKRSSVTENELRAMELFALTKVTEMAEGLKNGEISPDPLAIGNKLPCVYCDYKAMCKNANPLEYRSVRPEDEDLLNEELKRLSKQL
ncbi:MAG: PD-(D/E)XK nuclease family protein [Ruminococcus sp.]|nr:PD-(D/E)XK nuclease family protein [Ruminococcus sp.]